MGDSSKNHTRIHRRQSGLAFAAVLAASPGLVFGLGTALAALFVLTFASVTVPLFMRREPRVFSRSCTVLGLALVAWSVVGVMLGMFLFLPAAVLLMLAAGAGPRRSPGAARLLSAAGGLVLAGVVCGSAMWCWHFYVSPASTRPHTYQAAIDAAWSTWVDPGQVTERLEPFGAVNVWITQDGGSDKAYLEVRFSDSLSDAQRTTLKRQISELPGVGRIALCQVRDCG